MSLIIYNGDKRLFAYKNQITDMGGIEYNPIYTFHDKQIAIAWLRNITVRNIVLEFINKLINKKGFFNKEFPILTLQDYMYKKIKKLTLKEDIVFNILIYSSYSNRVIYTLDHERLDEYKLTDIVTLGNRCESATGALSHCKDPDIVMQKFAEYFPICGPEYNAIKLR
jgi:hypothetical protein